MTTSTSTTNAELSAADRRIQQPVAARHTSLVEWDRATWLGLLTLVVLWATLFAGTWASWGSVTVDCGREMYVAAEVARGRTLYKDVWYIYGPIAPYINAFLFRLFGARLEVLYWAGSLSALGSAIFLFLSGIRLSSRLTGWTAAAVVLVGAFSPSIFCFPLPYSFPAVYGCLTACALLWLGLQSLQSESLVWLFAAGIAACLALLLKLETGCACYAFLGVLLGVRAIHHKSGRAFWRDVLAVLPGGLVCAVVAWWMISLRGVEFITQENFSNWPTSYFMRTYGKHWLEITGMPSTFGHVALPSAVLLIFWCFLRWGMPSLLVAKRWFLPTGLVLIGMAGALVTTVPGELGFYLESAFLAVFFPRIMALLAVLGLCGAVWLLWKRRLPSTATPILMVLVFSCLLAFRLLLSVRPTGYSIYYGGPVVLSFLLLGPLVVPAQAWAGRLRQQWRVLLCVGCLVAASASVVRNAVSTKNWIPLKTEYGTIRLDNEHAKNYSVALEFMKQRSAGGEYVLSIPEDVSLYFLSGTECPSRLYMFHPGLLAPGNMTTELIDELRSKPVRYLIWSNREFPEYGAPVFGKDYDWDLGNYLRAHYRPLRPLIPDDLSGWSAVIWEQIPGEKQ